MTERAWQTATDPLAMLDHLYPMRGQDSIGEQERKSRLYLIACGRQAADRLPGVCRVVLRLAERVYGGRVIDSILRKAAYPSAEALTHCRGEVEDVNAIGRGLADHGWATPDEVCVTADIDPEAWRGFAHLAFFPFSHRTPHYRRVPADLHSADLIREIYGNPFVRLPRSDPGWRTSTVMDLARTVDATDDFSILPILADALQDAGCDRQDVLDHLRHGGPHARGCWAVEWVLQA